MPVTERERTGTARRSFGVRRPDGINLASSIASCSALIRPPTSAETLTAFRGPQIGKVHDVGSVGGAAAPHKRSATVLGFNPDRLTQSARSLLVMGFTLPNMIVKKGFSGRCWSADGTATTGPFLCSARGVLRDVERNRLGPWSIRHHPRLQPHVPRERKPFQRSSLQLRVELHRRGVVLQLRQRGDCGCGWNGGEWHAVSSPHQLPLNAELRGCRV